MTHTEFLKELHEKKTFLTNRLNEIFDIATRVRKFEDSTSGLISKLKEEMRKNAIESEEGQKTISAMEKWLLEASQMEEKSPEQISQDDMQFILTLKYVDVEAMLIKLEKNMGERRLDEADLGIQKDDLEQAPCAESTVWKEILTKKGFKDITNSIFGMAWCDAEKYVYDDETDKSEKKLRLVAVISSTKLRLTCQYDNIRFLYRSYETKEDQESFLANVDIIINQTRKRIFKRGKDVKITVDIDGQMLLELEHKEHAKFDQCFNAMFDAIKLMKKEDERKYPFQDVEFYEKASIKKMDLLTDYLEKKRHKKQKNDKTPLFLSAFGCLLNTIMTTSRSITKKEVEEYFTSYVNGIIDYKRELQKRGELYESEEFDLEEKRFYLNMLAKMSKKDFEKKKQSLFEI